MEAETRYGRSGDVSIAYQVTGDGPFDVVYVPPFVSHVELAWEVPGIAAINRRLSSFSRLIRFDKRGTGMSDRVSGVPTLETRMDDVRAVMDAVGSERAALIGVSEGGPMSILFAATYPERAWALALCGTFASERWAPDYPFGIRDEEARREEEEVERNWGTPAAAAAVAQALAPSASRGAAGACDLDSAKREPGCGARAGAHEPRERRAPCPAGDPGADARAQPRGGAPLHPSRVGLSCRAHPWRPTRRVDRRRSRDLRRQLGTVRSGARGFPAGGLGGGGDRRTGSRPSARDDPVHRHRRLDGEGGRARRRPLARVARRPPRNGAAAPAALPRHGARHRRRRLLRRFDGPARGIRCARAITESVRDLGIEVRAGLHTGECERMNAKVGGIAVHIGARVAAEAGPGEVVVSSTVKDLVAGSGIAFSDRGAAELKGVPGEWRLFAVESG